MRGALKAGLLGGRAPEFINWTFGLQRQLANKITLTATYVGSEGHFLQLDSYHARGYWADDLDPKYLLTVGSHLSDIGSAIAADCATYNLPCPANFDTKQSLATALKPFPFQSVADNFGYVGNASYHALQAFLSMRNWRGLTLRVNYTLSRSIDDGGYFRTGYPIPAGTINGAASASYSADRIDRSVSTSNQPQHFVTTAVWAWPFGRSVFAENAVERAVMGGFSFSGVYQAYSGSPLMITSSACASNPALTDSSHFCPPTLNSSFTGPARINGKMGKGCDTGKHQWLQWSPVYRQQCLRRHAGLHLWQRGAHGSLQPLQSRQLRSGLGLGAHFPAAHQRCHQTRLPGRA